MKIAIMIIVIIIQTYIHIHAYIHLRTLIYACPSPYKWMQVIAQFPWFIPALTEKALLLASAGEWEQSLDAAQRVLDLDSTNIDAVQIVAVHAFTQECHPHDSLQKLEDLDSALSTQEPSSMKGLFECAELFSCICSRQPRALQICLRLLDRAYKNCYNGIEESMVLMLQGKIYLMQVCCVWLQSFRDLEFKTQDPFIHLVAILSYSIFYIYFVV